MKNLDYKDNELEIKFLLKLLKNLSPTDDTYQYLMNELLKKYSACKLIIDKNEFDLFSKSSLTKLLAQPIDIDFLQLYMMIDGVEKSKDRISITLRLREEL